MTISSTTTRTDYSGNGSTLSFSSVFVFWDLDDPKVILVSSSGNETTYTRGSEYTISAGGGGAAGTILISSSIPPDTGETLIVKSNVPNTQETDLTPGGAFETQDVEDELDRTVRRIQQQVETIDRSILLSEASTFTGLTLPDPEALKVIAWDSSADGTLVNVTRNSSEFIEIGVDVQAWDADLDTISGLSKTADNFIVADGSSWAVQTTSEVISTLGVITAASTTTFTNKTFDANASGNALSNVDVADLATGTDGELITWSSTAGPTTVAVGTATEVLTSNGVGAAPTFQAAASGGWEFIEAATASTSASITFSHTIASGFDYIVTGRNIKNSADTVATDAVALQVGTGGTPTFQTTAYVSEGIILDDSGVTGARSIITDGMPLWGNGTIGGTGAGEVWSFEAVFLDPGDGSVNAECMIRSTTINVTPDITAGWVNARWTTATAVTGIRIDATGAQTMTTGEFILSRRKLS